MPNLLPQYKHDNLISFIIETLETNNTARGGFRGGGADASPPLRDSTPRRPKGSPFVTFSEIHFWPTDPKIFLKATSAPIYTNFKGERAPKKRDFFVKKCPKTAFFDCFFKNLPPAQKI